MGFGGKGRRHLIGGRPSTKAVISPCGEEYRASKGASYPTSRKDYEKRGCNSLLVMKGCNPTGSRRDGELCY